MKIPADDSNDQQLEQQLLEAFSRPLAFVQSANNNNNTTTTITTTDNNNNAAAAAAAFASMRRVPSQTSLQQIQQLQQQQYASTMRKITQASSLSAATATAVSASSNTTTSTSSSTSTNPILPSSSSSLPSNVQKTANCASLYYASGDITHENFKFKILGLYYPSSIVHRQLFLNLPPPPSPSPSSVTTSSPCNSNGVSGGTTAAGMSCSSEIYLVQIQLLQFARSPSSSSSTSEDCLLSDFSRIMMIPSNQMSVVSPLLPLPPSSSSGPTAAAAQQSPQPSFQQYWVEFPVKLSDLCRDAKLHFTIYSDSNGSHPDSHFSHIVSEFDVPLFSKSSSSSPSSSSTASVSNVSSMSISSSSKPKGVLPRLKSGKKRIKFQKSKTPSQSDPQSQQADPPFPATNSTEDPSTATAADANGSLPGGFIQRFPKLSRKEFIQMEIERIHKIIERDFSPNPSAPMTTTATSSDGTSQMHPAWIGTAETSQNDSWGLLKLSLAQLERLQSQYLIHHHPFSNPGAMGFGNSEQETGEESEQVEGEIILFFPVYDKKIPICFDHSQPHHTHYYLDTTTATTASGINNFASNDALCDNYGETGLSDQTGAVTLKEPETLSSDKVSSSGSTWIRASFPLPNQFLVEDPELFPISQTAPDSNTTTTSVASTSATTSSSKSSSLSSLSDTLTIRMNPIEDKHLRLALSLNSGLPNLVDRDLRPTSKERHQLVMIMNSTPLQELTIHDKKLLWRYRYYCSQSMPRILVKFLRCIDPTRLNPTNPNNPLSDPTANHWNSAAGNGFTCNNLEIKEALRLFSHWSRMDKIEDYLILLSCFFCPRIIPPSSSATSSNISSASSSQQKGAKSSSLGPNPSIESEAALTLAQQQEIYFYSQIRENVVSILEQHFSNSTATSNASTVGGAGAGSEDSTGDIFLGTYLLQLVQSLRYDYSFAKLQTGGSTASGEGDFSKLERFLIRRATNNFEIANSLFWFLHVEISNPGNSALEKSGYNRFLIRFLRELNQKNHSRQQQQQLFLNRLTRQTKLVESLKELFTALKKSTNSSAQQSAATSVQNTSGSGSTRQMKINRMKKILSENRDPFKWQDIFTPSNSTSTTPPVEFYDSTTLGGDSNPSVSSTTSISLAHSSSIKENFLKLPLCPTLNAVGFVPEESTIFKSAKAPLGLSFKLETHASTPSYRVLFKMGDDLRQDQLVIQMIRLMDNLLKKEGLDLKLTPYRVLSTSVDSGFVERIYPSIALSEILSSHNGDIRKYFQKCNPTPNKFAECMDNYVKSCAGYCVITYLLGIGDRHLDNLLMTPEGHLFHIDFGFILGKDPKPFPPPMKLCKEMIEAMRAPSTTSGGVSGAVGGTAALNSGNLSAASAGVVDVTSTSTSTSLLNESSYYLLFKTLCCESFNILRKNANLILNLLVLMIDAKIPDISLTSTTTGIGGGVGTGGLGDPLRNLLKVQEKFKLELSDEMAIQYMQNVLSDSVKALFPQITETIHRWAQYWRS